MDAGTARDLALAIPGTTEADHFGNPSYRANSTDAQGRTRKGVIFMTLRIEEGAAVLLLTVEQQTDLCARHPEVFAALPNKWGAKGATGVLLAKATERILRPAMDTAWRNALR